MRISPHAAAAATPAPRAHTPPVKASEGGLNPAQQARAADPAAKGAAFGALVSQFARAKHDPAPVAAPPPPPPPSEPVAEVPVEPPVEAPVDAAPPPPTPAVIDPLADLVVEPPPVDTEPGSLLDIVT